MARPRRALELFRGLVHVESGPSVARIEKAARETRAAGSWHGRRVRYAWRQRLQPGRQRSRWPGKAGCWVRTKNIGWPS